MPPAALPAPDTLPDMQPASLLDALLDVSLTGVIFFRPLYGGADAGTITDLAYVRLNAAAQRMLARPECPPETFLTLYPNALDAGIFAFYRDTFLSGTAGRYNAYYQHDGLDNYFHLAARRSGELLVVSFTDTADHGRSAAEAALRVSQTREQAARAEAEAARAELQRLFEQAPVAVAALRGPRYVVEWANPAICRIWGRTPAQAQGQPLFGLLPEAAGQGFEELLDGVRATGVPYVAHELPALLDRHGRRETVYCNFVYQPLRDADGPITGVMVVATDVSEQVRAREQVRALNQELAAANAALSARLAELERSQQQLRELNRTLDALVAERTATALAARAEAEGQRQRLERLFMAAPAAIAILAGPELVYELVNPAYCQLLPAREMLGQPLLQAVPELANQPTYHALRRVFDTGQPHTDPAVHIRLARPTDGAIEDRYFNLVYQPRHDEHGRVDGVLAFGFEITAQVLARQASEASARQYRLVTDALPVLISYIDQEQRYRLANRAYGEWFGQPAAALLGRTVREVVGEDAYATAQGYIGRALAGEPLTFEARMTYRPDFVRHIRTSFVPDVQDGRVAGFYSLVTDVSGQVEAHQQVLRLNLQLATVNERLSSANQALTGTNDALTSANERLTRANVDLDTFVYTASHDLKGPIGNLDGLLQALREELPLLAPASPAAHILALMEDSVSRFLHTLDQLGNIAQLQHEQPAAPVRLADVLRDVRLDLAPLIADTAAQLEEAVAGSPALRLSEKNLRSVLYNLLSNALKYRHPARTPHIRIGCRRTAGHWVLTVQDNGLGLALGPDRPLFGLFQRYHPHIEGSGVGLFMVKRMVENAGGRIEVASQPEVGTTFTVYFPR